MDIKHALRVFLTRVNEVGFLKTALYSLKKFSGIEERDREIESLYYIVNHCIDITKFPPASGNLRKYQLCGVSLLKTFDAICKKQGWSYWLHAGTLLGAARHKGFIPWDDDIDVAMPRKDYNEALSKLHEICALYSSDLKSRGDIVMGKLQYGNVFIDLFPCDEILSDSEDNDETEAIRHAEQKVDKYAKFFYAHTKANKKIDKKEYDNIINERNSIFYEGGGIKYLVKEPEYALTFALHKPFVCSYDSIFPLSKIQFEDFIFPAPADTHKDLTLLYGDYMSFPRGRLLAHMGKSVSNSTDDLDALLEKLHDIERFYFDQL